MLLIIYCILFPIYIYCIKLISINEYSFIFIVYLIVAGFRPRVTIEYKLFNIIFIIDKLIILYYIINLYNKSLKINKNIFNISSRDIDAGAGFRLRSTKKSKISEEYAHNTRLKKKLNEYFFKKRNIQFDYDKFITLLKSKKCIYIQLKHCICLYIIELFYIFSKTLHFFQKISKFVKIPNIFEACFGNVPLIIINIVILYKIFIISREWTRLKSNFSKVIKN